jgi:hypothetical protein
MNEQAMVDQFATLAKPRLMELLKLKVRHVYDPTPGNANSAVGGDEYKVDFKLLRAAQPYGDIERFVAADKVIGFIVNPGLLPIAKAIAMDVRGRGLLITRMVEAHAGDRGVTAHVDGFGIRIMMYFDEASNETQIVWECLYGVA